MHVHVHVVSVVRHNQMLTFLFIINGELVSHVLYIYNYTSIAYVHTCICIQIYILLYICSIIITNTRFNISVYSPCALCTELSLN